MRFRATPEDFRVDEIPLYRPAGEGEHTFLLVEKPLKLRLARSCQHKKSLVPILVDGFLLPPANGFVEFLGTGAADEAIKGQRGQVYLDQSFGKITGPWSSLRSAPTMHADTQAGSGEARCAGVGGA